MIIVISRDHSSDIRPIDVGICGGSKDIIVYGIDSVSGGGVISVFGFFFPEINQIIIERIERELLNVAGSAHGYAPIGLVDNSESVRDIIPNCVEMAQKGRLVSSDALKAHALDEHVRGDCDDHERTVGPGGLGEEICHCAEAGFGEGGKDFRRQAVVHVIIKEERLVSGGSRAGFEFEVSGGFYDSFPAGREMREVAEGDGRKDSGTAKGPSLAVSLEGREDVSLPFRRKGNGKALYPLGLKGFPLAGYVHSAVPVAGFL